MKRIPRQAYHRTVLDNGLRILTAPRWESESVSIGIWIGVGGRYESAGLNGISHLLEHLIFKGTPRRSSHQIKVAIEGTGGALNAFTDEEFTCLYAKVQPKNLGLTVDVLSDMILSSELEPRELEKERAVVIEEIRMYRDLPMQYVHDLLNVLLWPNHPLGRQIAGTERSLKRIQRKDLIRFQKRYYTPRNICIAACGRLTHRALVETVKKAWESIPAGICSTFRKAVERQSKARMKIERKDTEQTHFSLGFHAFPRNHPQMHALSLLNVLLGGNMSSRLFRQVREERGLAYEIGSQVKRYRDTGLFSVSAGVEHRHLLRCLEVVRKELVRVRKEQVSRPEFERTAEYLTGQALFALEDTVEHMFWMGECEMLLGRVEPVEVILDQVGQVRRHDLKEVARAILRPKHLSLAVIGPVQPKVQAQIQRLFSS